MTPTCSSSCVRPRAVSALHTRLLLGVGVLLMAAERLATLRGVGRAIASTIAGRHEVSDATAAIMTVYELPGGCSRDERCISHCL